APFKFRQTVGLALPDHDSPPTELLKSRGVLDVPLSVPFELRCPVQTVGLGHVAFTAILVSMPEASVHEYDYPPFRQHHIGFARKIFPVQPEPETHPMQYAPNTNFGLGVARCDPAHNLRPSLDAVNIRHASPCAHSARLHNSIAHSKRTWHS